MKDGTVVKDLFSEPGRNYNVVVLSRLVCSNQHRVGLTDMNVKRGIGGLDSVSPLNFNECHIVSLNPKIE